MSTAADRALRDGMSAPSRDGPSPALPHPARESEQALRIGFLGLGWIGRLRLDAIATLCDCVRGHSSLQQHLMQSWSRQDAPGRELLCIAALADPDEQRLQRAAQAYPEALAVAGLDELLEQELDGVVIATPNAAHAQQAIRCLARGVAVFCQKPLATNAADSARVIAAARAADRLLAVDYSYRHVRGMPELRRRISAGELGEIVAMDLRFHNAYGPDKAWCSDARVAGGGCLLDLGVHLIDLASWLQDGPGMHLVGSRIYRRGMPRSRGEIEDMAYAELRQDNGAIVRLACSWHAHAGCDALIGADIFGTQGGAAWRNLRGSFYDFEIEIFHGTRRERIGLGEQRGIDAAGAADDAARPAAGRDAGRDAIRDEWGPRALHAWLHRLAHDRSFDPDVLQTLRHAQLIEEIYRA